MNRGLVYSWIPASRLADEGRVEKESVQLERLEVPESGEIRLRGRFVHVRNGGAIYEPHPEGGPPVEVPLGDAQPNAEGDFLFEPGRGGGRIDKVKVAAPDFRWRYAQAAHFGEVNTYYHADRVAAYVDSILNELGAPSLPPVRVLVNAHHAAVENDGVRDGVRRLRRWVPFQGGHYRLACTLSASSPPPAVAPDHEGTPPAETIFRRYTLVERTPIHPEGEIHLGPGWKLLRDGALVNYACGPYRANASHNAGIIYHEYGHHLTRHTADLCGNAVRGPENQINVKSALDEGMSDYLAASMLQTPHIWAFHHGITAGRAHPRSLSSAKTMSEFDPSPGADPHANGTIWAATLWDLRQELVGNDPNASRDLDRMVILSLLLIGQIEGDRRPPTPAGLRRGRATFATALRCLLEADDTLYAGRHQDAILRVVADRGIHAPHHVSTRS